MSAIHKPRPPLDMLEDDPFRLGWRYVPKTGKDGRQDWVQVPLTEEDVLFPEEEDFIVNNYFHRIDADYLRCVFEAAVMAVIGAVVVGDLRIAWGVRGIRPMGPDIAVIFNVRQRRRWGTFYAAKEGTQPELVVEVTSQTTRKNDLRRKRHLYFRVGVPCYVIVDELPGREAGPRRLRLLGYRRGRHGFERLQPNERGWLWLESVGLWLGIDGERVACYDRDGRRIPDYAEIAQAHAAAEECVRQLEDELRRQRNGRG